MGAAVAGSIAWIGRQDPLVTSATRSLTCGATDRSSASTPSQVVGGAGAEEGGVADIERSPIEPFEVTAMPTPTRGGAPCVESVLASKPTIQGRLALAAIVTGVSGPAYRRVRLSCAGVSSD